MKILKHIFLNFSDAHDNAEKYKRQCEKLEAELKVASKDNIKNEISIEQRELIEETLNKLEMMINTNEQLEAENDDLIKQLNTVRKQLSDVEQKSVGNAETLANLEKEIVTMKEKVEKLEKANEKLKQEKAKAQNDIAQLMKKVEEVEVENGKIKEKSANIEIKMQEAVDENIGLKIDLSDKNMELERITKKLAEAEKKAVQTVAVANRTNQPVPWNYQNQQQQHQISMMQNHIHYLNQQYVAVCQERDAMRNHIHAIQG